MPLPRGLLCATSPSRVVWRSRARVCLLLSPFTLFLSLPIHSSGLPRSLSLSPVRHGRAAELLHRSLLHCLDIIEPPSSASASASGASTASPTLAAPPFAVPLSAQQPPPWHAAAHVARRAMGCSWPCHWPGVAAATPCRVLPAAAGSLGRARPAQAVTCFSL